jgi:hypothetical protein
MQCHWFDVLISRTYLKEAITKLESPERIYTSINSYKCNITKCKLNYMSDVAMHRFKLVNILGLLNVIFQQLTHSSRKIRLESRRHFIDVFDKQSSKSKDGEALRKIAKILTLVKTRDKLLELIIKRQKLIWNLGQYDHYIISFNLLYLKDCMIISNII